MSTTRLAGLVLPDRAELAHERPRRPGLSNPLNGIDALVPVGGRMISESFSNVACDDVDKQPGRIVATRDHDPARLFGKVVDIEPCHADGLHATIQASNTPLGLESVQLARDQVLDVSIGFQIPAGGEVWDGRSRRRITRALLREVALVPEPAYPTRVLDVRGPVSVR